MFRGYKLSLENELSDNFAVGYLDYSIHQNAIKEKLTTFSSQGIYNGAMLEDEWFPQFEADVFISHSHNDERLAISFAGWLQTHFGIKAFVDSAAWKNAYDLLKIVDNDFCRIPGTSNYDYQSRNRTTAHIHMMLNAALMKMMDSAECFFLINTPSAIFTEGVVEETYSPWLYSELSLSKLLRVKQPIRPLLESRKLYSDGGEIDIIKAKEIMTHKADTRHLKPLNVRSLSMWRRMAGNQSATTALDYLYYFDDTLSVTTKSFSEK
jgi:hypothetical protein